MVVLHDFGGLGHDTRNQADWLAGACYLAVAPDQYWWAAPRLERALAVNGMRHDIKVYPEASHGFLNDHPPEDLTPLSVVLSRLSGTRCHEPSAQDARRRIIRFFDAHLKS